MAATRKKKRVLTPEQSRRRSEITKKVRPWLAAKGRQTGPRTAEGKARSRMNALKHGEWDAAARAGDKFMTAATRVQQCMWAIGLAELGAKPKVTYFVKRATVGDYFTACAQLQVDRPPIDSDIENWNCYLARIAEARPDLPESVARVPLLALCTEIRAERRSPLMSLT